MHRTAEPDSRPSPAGESQPAERRLESLLARVIIRLTLATAGLDRALDPLLIQIRDLLRKGVADDGLGRQLDALSESLLRASKGEETAPEAWIWQSQLLFRFLARSAGSPAEHEAIAALRDRVEGRDITDEDALFSALTQLRPRGTDTEPERPHPPKAGFLKRLFVSARTHGAPSVGAIDHSALRTRVLALLDAVQAPAGLKQHADQLRLRLERELTTDAVLSTVSDTLDLVLKIDAHTRDEQKAFESFLSELTRKLGDLEVQALGIQRLNQDAAEQSESVHTAWSDEVRDLRTRVGIATDLDQLKSVINSHLAAIAGRLSAARDIERKRQRETERQLDQLTNRLKETELETRRLRLTLQREHDLAFRDALTGLPNRMAYEERIAEEVARWKRFRHPLSLLVWDVDHFKAINDRFGHQAGDKVLATVGKELSKAVRATDFVARYGGEEFVMLLPGTPAEAALRVADKIRATIKGCGFNSEGRPVAVTLSCGLSAFRGEDTPDTVFQRADQALYQAKQQGRDRCVAAADDTAAGAKIVEREPERQAKPPGRG